jgi:predicted phosphodiesterase
VRLGVIADVHWPGDPACRASWHNRFDFEGLPARLRSARGWFDAEAVDAIVVAGDLTHDGDLRSARAACVPLAGGAPVLVVAGNHDCLQHHDELPRSLPDGAAMLGGAGLQLGGRRVAGIAIAPDRDNAAHRWTAAPPDDRAPAAVVVSHFPVLSRAERLAERGLAYPGDLANRRALRERLGGRGPVVVLSGHIHAREACADGTIIQLSAGALVEPPHEVAVVDLDAATAGVRVRRRVRCLGPGSAVRDPVLAPPDETWRFSHGAWRVERAA